MNQALIAFSCLVIISTIISIVRVIKFGTNLVFFINLTLTAFLITVTIFRKRIHLYVKLSLVVTMAYIALVNGLSNIGFLASAKAYMALMPILIMFLADYKYVFGTLLIFLFTFLIFGILFNYGILEYSVEPNSYVESAIGWFFDAIITAGVVWALSYAGSNYFKTLQQQLTLVKTQNDELEYHRNHLEKIVDKKTNELKKSNKELMATVKNLRETQVQLVQSEKMASLGVLTAGVAHEINNPLNYIMGAYEGLKQNYEANKDAENQKYVGELLEALKLGLDRSSDIVKGLNQFSRSNNSLDENCNIHTILDNTVSMLNNQLKNKINLIKAYDNSEVVIKGNIGSLHQVFLNIIGNAIQAIETSGEIKIITENQKTKVLVTISDNGIGIPKENLTKLTDPFFTTKNSENRLGSGLGLYITYNIVKEHRGKLDITSEEGKGTFITITFPKK